MTRLDDDTDDHSPTWTPPRFDGGRGGTASFQRLWGSRKFAYKLTFKPFQIVFRDCPTEFRIKMHSIFTVNIWYKQVPSVPQCRFFKSGGGMPDSPLPVTMFAMLRYPLNKIY
jgi:hypothetical protein